MIDFMIIAAPRSGTAWSANWLTTESAICLHDPLFEHAIETWDSIPCDRRLGVACTGSAMFSSVLNRHPARKVVLHRPIHEINASLYKMGLPSINVKAWSEALVSVHGLHLDWRSLWDGPRRIWEHLMDTPFDARRHALLRKLNVQMDFEHVHPDPVAVRNMFRTAGML